MKQFSHSFYNPAHPKGGTPTSEPMKGLTGGDFMKKFCYGNLRSQGNKFKTLSRTSNFSALS